MRKSLKFSEVIAVLMNGGFIVQCKPIVFGRSVYKVMMPGAGNAPDSCVAYITERMACDVWDAGFLVALTGGHRLAGDFEYTAFGLSKPSLSFLESPRSGDK